jgi:hypothetical protein
MKVIDPGHMYLLTRLDVGTGYMGTMLTFVKRCGPKFPGNTGGNYPGTTLQNVLRALCDRMRYLQNQVWAAENVVILFALRLSIWLLEFRAARRHGRSYFHGLDFAEKSPMCSECGHTDCHHANHTH